MGIAFAGCTALVVGHHRGKGTETSGMAVAPKRPAARPAISTSSHVSCAMPNRTARPLVAAEAIAFRLVRSPLEVTMTRIQHEAARVLDAGWRLAAWPRESVWPAEC